MASRFDPSRFIKAEQSQGVAALATDFSWSAPPKEANDFEPVSTAGERYVATVATVAAPPAEKLPWDDELRAFVTRSCPPDVGERYWSDLVQSAWEVSRGWGARAPDSGWTELDLFGCNPVPFPYARRVDRDGLVMAVAGLLTPVRVTNLDRHAAELTGNHGSVMRFRPPVGAGATLIWDAYPLTSGP